MPACLSRTLGLPPIIPSKMSPTSGSHYSSDNGNRANISSLRRTLSAADVSSKIWEKQGGSIKKIASVEHLQSLIHEEDPKQNESGSGAIEDIWSSIQNRGERMKAEDSRLPRQSDVVWGSIINSKKKEGDDVAPYVHPMVKRTTSSLSEKSLEICTESLGSETGADGFSFCVEIEKKEDENDVVVAVEGQKEEPRQQEEVVGPTNDHYQEMARGVSVARYTGFMKKAGAAGSRALPPPLPSLAGDGGGSNVQMRSHRENGRLVVEAVSVPSRNCFKAERHDGRLLLTFSDLLNRYNDDEETEENEEEVEFEDGGVKELLDLEDEEDEEDEEEEVLTDNENEIMVNTGSVGEGMRNYVHYKFLWLTRNTTINKLTNEVEQSTMLTVDRNSNSNNNNDNRVNKVVATLEVDDATLAKSLSKVGHLNPYVYSWRSNQLPPGHATLATTASLKDIDAPPGGGVVVVKGNCSQQQPTTRSLLLWDTRCIATS